MKARRIVIALLVVLLAIITVQNLHHATLSILFWGFSIPLILLILLIFIAGFLTGYILSSAGMRKKGMASLNGSAERMHAKKIRDAER